MYKLLSMRPHTPTVLLATLTLLPTMICPVLTGCSEAGRTTARSWGGTSGTTGRPGAAELTALGKPFAPAQLSIFPLTQLEQDERGNSWLLLFIELRDRWSDPVKAPGWLTVYLEPAGRAAGVSEPDARWDIDLSDPSVNSALFDPVTRTYRMQLGGLPPRVQAMTARSMQRRAGDEIGAAREQLFFRARFITVGSDGNELILWDAFTLDS